jgi:diguanylate cyclase (GGDEF)-like protein
LACQLPAAFRSPQLILYIFAVLAGLFVTGGLSAVRLDAPWLAIVHCFGDVVNVILGSIIFFIAWYGTCAKDYFRVSAGSLAIFAAAILELVHLLAFPGTLANGPAGYDHVWLTSGVFARLVWSFGLLYAIALPSGTAPSARVLLYGTLLAVAGLVINIVANPGLWPYLDQVDRYDHPLVVGGQVAAAVADFAVLYILCRRPADHAGRLPQTALCFAAAADLCFAAAGHTASGINIAGHFFQALANFYILQTLYILTVRQPFAVALKLKENMAELAENNAKLFQESEAQRGLFEDILAKVGTIISSQLDLKETLEAIADMIADMMRSRQSLVALFTEDKSALQVAATCGMNTPPRHIPLQNSLSAQVCEQNATLIIDDLTLHPEIFRPQQVFTSIRSIIAAPLVTDREIIGVIEAYSGDKTAFTARDIQLLTALGHHAGAAVAAATLHEQTKLRLDEEKILLQITQAAASTVDSDVIVRQCLAHTSEALNADVALAFAAGDDKATLSLKHSLGLSCRQSAFRLGTYPELAEKVRGLAPSMITADQFPLADFSGDFFAGTLMLLPLPVNSNLLGLFVLGWQRYVSRERGARTSFAALLAQQTAIGLEKADLYNQVKAMALSDGLTGLANRRNFDMFLKTELQRAAVLKRPTSLVMLDLDKFKSYNDSYGHTVGDLMLAQMGEILRRTVRSIDFPARYGGEEFAVILPECGQGDAIGLAERIREAVATAACPDSEGSFSARITASLGIATYDPALAAMAPEPAKLIAVADSALYQAKQSGRNKVVSAPLIA